MNRSRDIIKNHLILKQICRYYGAIREETHYDVLGISKDASKQDIRLAYLKLSKEKHPDRNIQDGKESHADFVKINEAYNVLSKTDLKEQYDEKLKFGNVTRVSRRSPYHGPEDYHMYDTYYNVTMNVNRKNTRYRNANYPYRVFLSKTQAVLLCLMIWILGNIFHIWAVMKSPTFNRQSLLERSHKFSLEEEKVRIRARENKLIYDDNSQIALALFEQLGENDHEGDENFTEIIKSKR